MLHYLLILDASYMRHRITFLRHRCFSICVIARHRNKDAHIADYKRVTVASWVVRHSYISKDIYTDPYKGRPNIL